MLLKRIIDILGSLSALLLLSPVIALVAWKIRRSLGSPVVFRQDRIGLNNTGFRLMKFRSMTDATDDAGLPLPDAQRLTPFGLKLRSTSLDELPTLVSVLRGHMSLVGPRPLLPEYQPLYSVEQLRRHDVKPGVTGWAQINGRNALSWEEKFRLDVWYVDNQSNFLDLKILFLTVAKVFKREGIQGEGEVTMSRFTGSQSD